MGSKASNRGSVMLLALVFAGIFITMFVGVVDYANTYAKLERQSIASIRALQIAQGAIDKAVYELNQDASYSGESGTSLGSGVFTTSVTSIDGSTKQITATAYVPDNTDPVATRQVKATVSVNSAIIAFNYGIQVGTGGFHMDGGSTVNGGIYSNGDIIATNGVHITGAAIAANPPATSADQVNNIPSSIPTCTASTCVTFANASATQDFAQSFRISNAVPMNNVQFYIKKVGSPSDITVRIVNDNGGLPSTDVLMTGTLSASAVTANFGWVAVSLPATPVLDPGETYWIVLDAGSSASKYYILGANAGGYASGTGKIGKYGTSWSDTSPSGLDGYFQIYLGGGTSTIGGSTNITGAYIGTTASDDAWAHTVSGATVTGTIYCQSGSNTNKACTTSRPDPTPSTMPISDSNIADWKSEAAAGGTTVGDVTVGWDGAIIGPREITGNLTVNGGGTLTVTGTIYVHGSLTISGGGKIALDSSYGSNDGIIVMDGPVSIAGGGTFSGSGTPGSYPFVLTTSSCPAGPGCAGANAIELSGGAGAVALVAQNGTAEIIGGSALKAVTARQIVMSGGASLTYDSGLINSNFSSGPGGSWQVVKGTYVVVPD